MVTAIIFGVLVLLMFLGVPIAASMALTTILSFLVLGGPDLLLMVPQRMYSGTTSFTLLAIPFFILAGNLMNTGGITTRLIHFAQCLVGHIRGGLGHVTVVTNMIMAGMSGAAVADAVGTGNILIPSMEKAGYPRVFSAALVGAAATIGPIIPPSIPFVIFGSMTGTSVGRLFLGGFLPGVLMGILLMITVAIISKKRGYPHGTRATGAELLRATIHAAPAWGSPLIIIGGILAGIFTPTEAAAVSAVYAFICAVFIYRSLPLREVPKVLLHGANTSAMLLYIITNAILFNFLLTSEQIPQALAEWVTHMNLEPWQFLVIVNITLLLAGQFMEPSSIILILAPLFLPIAKTLGIDPIHLGVIMTVNMEIGMLTPPVGLNLYVASHLSHMGLTDVSKAALPFVGVMILYLILVTYVPDISLWLVDLLYGATPVPVPGGGAVFD